MHEEILSDFEIPWCQELLTSPQIIDLSTPSRKPPPPNDKIVPNLLFSETWKSDTTIRAFKILRTRNVLEPNISPEYILLLSLGTGLGSFAEAIHGGAAAAILDQGISVASTRTGGPAWTKELSVQFKKSIRLPGVVACRSVVTSRQGRSLWVSSKIVDGEGTVYCEAKALCVVAERGVKKATKI